MSVSALRAHKTRIRGSSSPSRRPRCGAVGRQRRRDGVVDGYGDVIGGMWRAGGRKGRPGASGVRGCVWCGCGAAGGRPGGKKWWKGKKGGGSVFLEVAVEDGRATLEGCTVVRAMRRPNSPGSCVRYRTTAGRQAGKSNTPSARAVLVLCLCRGVCLRDSHDAAIWFPSPQPPRSQHARISSPSSTSSCIESRPRRQKQVRTHPLHCSATSPPPSLNPAPTSTPTHLSNSLPPPPFTCFPQILFYPPPLFPLPVSPELIHPAAASAASSRPRPPHPVNYRPSASVFHNADSFKPPSAHRARTCAGKPDERRGPISATGWRGGRSVHRLPRYCGLGEVQRSGCSGD